MLADLCSCAWTAGTCGCVWMSRVIGRGTSTCWLPQLVEVPMLVDFLNHMPVARKPIGKRHEISSLQWDAHVTCVFAVCLSVAPPSSLLVSSRSLLLPSYPLPTYLDKYQSQKYTTRTRIHTRAHIHTPAQGSFCHFSDIRSENECRTWRLKNANTCRRDMKRRIKIWAGI
jgi:hypothetical protein